MINVRRRRAIMRAAKTPTVEEFRRGLHRRIFDAIARLDAESATDPTAIRGEFEREMASRRMSFLERENWVRSLGPNYLQYGIRAVLAIQAAQGRKEGKL